MYTHTHKHTKGRKGAQVSGTARQDTRMIDAGRIHHLSRIQKQLHSAFQAIPEPEEDGEKLLSGRGERIQSSLDLTERGHRASEASVRCLRRRIIHSISGSSFHGTRVQLRWDRSLGCVEKSESLLGILQPEGALHQSWIHQSDIQHR